MRGFPLMSAATYAQERISHATVILPTNHISRIYRVHGKWLQTTVGLTTNHSLELVEMIGYFLVHPSNAGIALFRLAEGAEKRPCAASTSLSKSNIARWCYRPVLFLFVSILQLLLIIHLINRCHCLVIVIYVPPPTLSV